MRRIYKYTLTEFNCSVRMPKGAQMLSVIIQYDEPQVHALVDTDRPTTLRKFRVLGTGADATDVIGYTFLGTITQGALVWHVFYEDEPI
jgi:hypothetical protein